MIECLTGLFLAPYEISVEEHLWEDLQTGYALFQSLQDPHFQLLYVVNSWRHSKLLFENFYCEAATLGAVENHHSVLLESLPNEPGRLPLLTYPHSIRRYYEAKDGNP